MSEKFNKQTDTDIGNISSDIVSVSVQPYHITLDGVTDDVSGTHA